MVSEPDRKAAARAGLTGMNSGSHSGMFRLLISMEIFLRCPGLVTPMAVRSCRMKASGRVRLQVWCDVRAAHLRGHPADCGHVVSGAHEAGGVLLQLEVTEPLEDGLCVLQHKHPVIQHTIAPDQQNQQNQQQNHHPEHHLDIPSAVRGFTKVRQNS